MSVNRHPAGTSVGGEFAPGAAGEVDDILDFDEEGFSPDGEGSDFSRFGLTPEATPDGLEEAWAKHQAILEQKPPESADKAIARQFGFTAESNVIYTHVQENRAGIVYAEVTTVSEESYGDDDEIDQAKESPYYTDTETDGDEEFYFDGSRMTHKFAVPADDPLAGQLTALRDSRERVDDERGRHEREATIDKYIDEGSLGPWATMSDASAREISNVASAPVWASGAASMPEGEAERLERARQNVSDRQALDVALASGGDLPDDVARRHFALFKKMKETQKSRENMETATAARDEAQSLPEGSALRRHLLTPPPSWEYKHNVNAGTRKRKKMETRTVHPDAPIDRAVKDAEIAHRSDKREFDRFTGHLNDWANRGQAIIERQEKAERSMTEARNSAWRFGWPDDGTQPPPQPGESR